MSHPAGRILTGATLADLASPCAASRAAAGGEVVRWLADPASLGVVAPAIARGDDTVLEVAVEDVAVSFMRVLEGKRLRFDGPARLHAYLRRAVRNAVVDVLRHDARAPESLEALGYDPRDTRSDGYVRALEWEDEYLHFVRYLRRCDRDVAAVVVACHDLGVYPHEHRWAAEVAAHLDISLANLHVRANRLWALAAAYQADQAGCGLGNAA